MVTSAPSRPSSSPMMLKMKSVCASGRKNSFCLLSPSPSPKKPPEPTEISDCATWYPMSCRWAHGSRNALIRAQRYGEWATATQAIGSARSTEPTRYESRVPAANRRIASRTTSSTELPKSGSAMQSATSSPARTRCGRNPMENVATFSRFFAREYARYTTQVNLAISAGCRLTPGARSRRRHQLTLEKVEAVALLLGRRHRARRIDHHQTQRDEGQHRSEQHRVHRQPHRLGAPVREHGRGLRVPARGHESASTRARKVAPRCSKLRNWSYEAQAGDSSTTSPGRARVRARATARSSVSQG